jgi:hypothetical protein
MLYTVGLITLLFEILVSTIFIAYINTGPRYDISEEFLYRCSRQEFGDG